MKVTTYVFSERVVLASNFSGEWHEGAGCLHGFGAIAATRRATDYVIRVSCLLPHPNSISRNFKEMVQFDPNVRMGSPSSLPYDPDQDAAEKRDIRKKYRALEKRTGGP